MTARPGAVQTRDGKRHEGELSFTNNAVQISNEVASTSIPHDDIARLSFNPETIPGEAESKGEGMGLLGYYFANTNIHGPVQVRLDPLIAFDWGVTEPISGLGKDYFAVIWMGYLEAPASGEFTFTLNADDRARLKIGQDLAIEAHRRAQQEEATGKLTLEKGERYPLTLVYQDLLGAAKIRLTWSGPEVPQSVIPADRLYPASFVAEHAANIESAQGLLATTYEKPDFSGNTTSRVDRVIEPQSVTNLTRWTGQLRADHSEPYTLYVATDGPLRLRVNGKLLLDKWNHRGLAELKTITRLAQGEMSDIEMEAMSSVRLLWSSASQKKALIPATHLLPFRKAVEIPSPTGPDALLPAGVLLRNGSFIACEVESIEDDTVQCSRPFEGTSFPVHEVARIVCQPLPRTLSSRAGSSRSGVLLSNGDFIEGSIVGLEGTRVTINSVLLGLRTYDTLRQAAAVIIREVGAADPACEIHLRDQSILFTKDVKLCPNEIILMDTVLAGLRISEAEVQTIRLR